MERSYLMSHRFRQSHSLWFQYVLQCCELAESQRQLDFHYFTHIFGFLFHFSLLWKLIMLYILKLPIAFGKFGCKFSSLTFIYRNKLLGNFY